MMDMVAAEQVVSPNTTTEPIYYGPSAPVYKHYRIGVERIGACVVKLQPMVQAHWDELHPAPGALHVDWSTLMSMEVQGRAILISARDVLDGSLVGYFIGTVAQPLFQSNKQVFAELGFYVVPEHRKSQLGRAVLRYVESLARFFEFDRLEIFGLQMPGGRSPHLLYCRAGYAPIAIQYNKELV